MYRNLTEALVGSLDALLTKGDVVPSRNGETREIHAHKVKIERPCERVLMTPARGNNPFAALAETMWVMAGRDDMEFLSRYLPRAPDYSDDGVVWRGGYGPRLRSWVGHRTHLDDSDPDLTPVETTFEIETDQFEECYKILKADPASRQAVMIIFDPGQDYCKSKDIPCNNWLHFLIRDNKLLLTVGVRSNDAVWGFSGINVYEWSVLMQIMAHWLGVEVGTMAYVASSFHMYDQHYERARKIVSKAKTKTLYEFGFTPLSFETSWDDFDKVLWDWFRVADLLHKDWNSQEADDGIDDCRDALFQGYLTMLRAFHAFKADVAPEVLDELLLAIPASSDLRIAALDFFSRQKKFKGFVWTLSGLEEDYFEFYRKPPQTDISLTEVYSTLKVLHEKKSRAYGDSWKKHGEVLGVFSNITRKRDRIASLQAGATATSDEGMFDTVSDLCVYAGKYLNWLAEHHPDYFNDGLSIGEGFQIREFDAEACAQVDPHGFDNVVEVLLWDEGWEGVDDGVPPADLNAALLLVEKDYQILTDVLVNGKLLPERLALAPAAARMSINCGHALRFLTRENPKVWASFADFVERL